MDNCRHICIPKCIKLNLFTPYFNIDYKGSVPVFIELFIKLRIENDSPIEQSNLDKLKCKIPSYTNE